MLEPEIGPAGVSSVIRASVTATLRSGSSNGLPEGGGNSLSTSPSESLPSGVTRPWSRTPLAATART